MRGPVQVHGQTPGLLHDGDAAKGQELNAQRAGVERQAERIDRQGVSWDIRGKGAGSADVWPAYGQSPDAISEVARQALEGASPALQAALAAAASGRHDERMHTAAAAAAFVAAATPVSRRLSSASSGAGSPRSQS